MFRQYQEILGVKLKAFGILMDNLVYTVEKLNENGRNLSFITAIAGWSVSFASTLTMSASRMKRMSKTHEILLHQC